MALRPVSELGLVDLTDLASPGETSPAQRKPRPAGAKAKPAGPAGATKPRAKGSAQPKRASRAAHVARSPAEATPPTAPARTRRAPVNVAKASRIGIVAATWAVAGAGGVLLGRAAVRR